MEYREEKDTMGIVRVPAEAYWGAQTQRSFQNFKIGGRMPIEIIRAFAVLKKSTARANEELGKLPTEKANLIAQVCDEISNGMLTSFRAENLPMQRKSCIQTMMLTRASPRTILSRLQCTSLH